MFWSEPNKIFGSTLKKMEPKLREESYVGFIDVNCIVNSNGIYPLEFTARFGREDVGDRWSEEDSDRLHSWGYLRE